MSVKGKIKEITTITLKEELQVYYNGYTNIKHINVPLAYTDNGDIILDFLADSITNLTSYKDIPAGVQVSYYSEH